MLHKRGAFFLSGLLLALLAAACGTGNRLDTADPGQFPEGFFLPIVQTLDIQLQAELVGGVYDGAGNNLTYPANTAATSGGDFTIRDGTAIHSNEQIYDIDGNGVIDYIVLTIRALSAQARANTTVMGESGLEQPQDFVLVGGMSLEPGDANFSQNISLNLPLDGAAAALPDDLLPVYRFVPAFVDGRSISDDIGDDSGYWDLVGNGTVASNGLTVEIDVGTFGQYAVATEAVIHNQGEATDL